MQQFIGTKLINAKPMTRGEYNKYRGWQVPENENPEDAGYLVEYQDSPTANTPDHAGYVSWSPKDVFEKAYRRSDGMPFVLAIEALKKGLRVARKGWPDDMAIQLDESSLDTCLDHIQTVTIRDTLVDDWMIVK